MAKQQQWYQKSKVQSVLGVIVIAVFSVIGAVYLQGSKAATACVYNNYSSGSKGSCVKDIQLMLNYFCTDALPPVYRSKCMLLNVDGIFGPKTKSVTANFQNSAHIAQDGVVGKNTWYNLCRYTIVRYRTERPTHTYRGGDAYFGYIYAGCAQRWPNL